MSLTKAQAVFDATTPANGDGIAAYLFASARLTSAAIAGNESLRTIAALQDGAGTALTSTNNGGKQSLDVNVSGFSATDLHVDGTVADDDPDAGNPVKTGSRAVATLAAISAADDRADDISDLYRRKYVNDSANIALKTGNVTVTAAAASLGAPLAGRKRLVIQNNANGPIYLGFDNTVTASGATGGLVVPGHGGTWSEDIGDNIVVWAIAGSTFTNLINVTEAA